MSSGAAPQVTCPSCFSSLNVADNTPGAKITCPHCHTSFQIAAPDNSIGGASSSTSSEGLFGDSSPFPEAPLTTSSPLDSLDDEYRFSDPHPAPVLPGTSSGVTAPSATTPATFEFSFPCPVCRTSLDCSSTEIGKKTQCGDCHSMITVPQPDPSQIRVTGSRVDGSFTLSDAVDRPVVTTMAGNEPFKANADKMLARASQELNDEIKKTKRAIGEKDLRAVFGFVIQPTAIFRLAVMGVLAAVVFSLGGAAIAKLVDDKQFVMGFFYAAMALPIGVYWLLMLSASGLVVLNGVGSDSKEELPWPEFSPFELFGQAIPVLNALLYSWMPAVLFAILLGSTVSTHAATIAILVLGLTGMVFIFPIVLLSTLHEESLFMPISKSILKSMSVGRTYWTMFYQVAILLALFTGAIKVINNLVGPSGGLFAGPIIMFVSILYFRMLGWLVWRCGEMMTEEEEE